MAFEEFDSNLQGAFPDYYCVIRDKKQDFYWVINLEDHPNSFLLDKSYQQFVSSDQQENEDSYVIIQPQPR